MTIVRPEADLWYAQCGVEMKSTSKKPTTPTRTPADLVVNGLLFHRSFPMLSAFASAAIEVEGSDGMGRGHGTTNCKMGTPN
ncbi:hypothetical protein HS088_TW22G01258 [Tripterygium wilfordii]|uniref:Uncharacterized protein n=1 Tax=Tripterygium wilfordii TaxID=458696 RepID=A0A7J7C0D1_TRIWF|nr:hypothetical protein HS088_TW22G01258 [Tripterygium wilfordii]